MSKMMFRVVLVVVLASVLATIPAAAQPLMDIQESTLFPGSGDTIVVENAPYWWTMGDFAQGWRTFPNLPQMGRLEYDLIMPYNTLSDTGHCDFTLYVNNQRAGSFTVLPGEGSKHLDFSFPTIAGPEYKFYLELKNTVELNKGSIQIPLDTSTLYLYPPSACPAASALSTVGDSSVLDLLRRFRNEVLTSDPAMQERIGAYYEHAPEATDILASHPLLLARTANLLRKAVPPVQALLDGRGAEVNVPAGDLQAGYRLLNDLSELASPEFATSLQELRD